MTNVLWTIKDGCQVRISDMSDAHLVNAANLVVNRQWRLEFLPHLEAELARRGFKNWFNLTVIDDATMIEIGEQKHPVNSPILIHRGDTTTLVMPKRKRVIRVDRKLRKQLRNRK